jgi:hypothetical protein
MELARFPGVVTDQFPVVFPGVRLQREVALGIDDGG